MCAPASAQKSHWLPSPRVGWAAPSAPAFSVVTHSATAASLPGSNHVTELHHHDTQCKMRAESSPLVGGEAVWSPQQEGHEGGGNGGAARP